MTRAPSRLHRRVQSWLRRPPILELPRYVRAAHRCGLSGVAREHPVDVLRAVLSHGIGVRAVHAIHAAATPERLAFVDRYRQLTYREANQEIDALANAMRARLRVTPGAAVVVFMENRVEYPVTWFALFRMGATCAHVSRHATSDELESLVERSGARVLVVSSETLDVALAVARRRPSFKLEILHVDGGSEHRGAKVWSYTALVERSTDKRRTRRAPAAASSNVVYTSGTTGRPKGAVRDFSSIGAIELLQILDRLPLHVGSRHLVVAPMYHSSGQAFTLLNAALGASIWLQDSFDAIEVLQSLSRLRIDNVFMVPTMIRRVLDVDEELHRAHPTPYLEALISGAAPFSVGLRERAMARFGRDVVFDFYGATELGWVTLADGREMSARPGTLGRAIPGQEIGIFDEMGRSLPPGCIGKIYTRSAQHMQGYMRDEAATMEVSLGDWLTVEDTGYLDEDGYLFLTGRARDMVVSGGVNIYPVEVENMLSQHPSVEDVAVVGLPDEEWGERLVAVVVPARAFDSESVRSWAKERMAPYKVPRQWEVTDELPRNPTGKVLKRELVRRLTNA